MTRYGTCKLDELLAAVDAINDKAGETEAKVGIETRLSLELGPYFAQIVIGD